MPTKKKISSSEELNRASILFLRVQTIRLINRMIQPGPDFHTNKQLEVIRDELLLKISPNYKPISPHAALLKLEEYRQEILKKT